MEKEGISLDTELLRNYSKELNLVLEENTKKIHDLSNSNFNISSPKQLGRFYFR